MARIEKTIFISYRRADVYTALAVYQDLTSKGYDLFFDYTSISSGDFEQIIVSNIKARAHFLLILTPTALDRCSEPGDWLRREIETAIDEQRNVIPLFFKGFNFGSPSVSEKLTGKLGDLGRFNGLNVHEDYFQAAMDRLSRQFLSVPLEAILQPYSTKVRERVKEEQIAAENALQQKWEEIKEILKPAKEKAGISEQDQIEKTKNTPFNLERGKSPNLRRYGIGAGILAVTLLGILGVSSLIQNFGQVTPMPTFTSQYVVPFATTSVPPTQTQLVPISTEMETPIPPSATPTLTPTLGIGSTMVSEKDGMILLYVPAGEFTMGLDNDSYETDNPAHSVTLSAYWIDQTEVTNAMYQKCVEADVCTPPYSDASGGFKPYYGSSRFANFPVIHIAWLSASQYCEWVGRRLPTEAQWEKAARGATDERIYPWGDTDPFRDLANFGRQVNNTTTVNDQPDGRSPYGVLNMAGNVWEWVSDFYDAEYYRKSPSRDPEGPVLGEKRVMRGGSWKDYPATIRVVHRYADYLLSANSSLGFRCALSASE